MGKPLKKSDIEQMIADLRFTLKEKQRSLARYNEFIASGSDLYDIKFKTEDEITFLEKQIFLLEHPERNPQLYINFDVAPKKKRITKDTEK